MVSTRFRDPQALSSDLASLGTLQPRAFGSLNRVETLDLASNYYLNGRNLYDSNSSRALHGCECYETRNKRWARSVFCIHR